MPAMFDKFLGQVRDSKTSADAIADALEAAPAGDLARIQSSVSGERAAPPDYDRLYRLSAWGDSFTDIGAPWFQNAIPKYGVHYGGYTGESSTQIKTRMLQQVSRFNDVTLIWVGRNNFSAPATVKADIAEMISALTTPKRYLVISVVNGTTEPAGSALYSTIVALNNDLSALYGQNYLDARGILVAAYNPALPQDVIDHDNDVPPLSLRADTLHYNAAGARLVAAAISAWVNALPAPASEKTMDYRDADALYGNSPSFDVLNVSAGGAVRMGGKPMLQARVEQGSYFLAGAYNYTTTGARNIAMGDGAMLKATTASGSVAIGNNALTKVTTGDGNFAVGADALASATTGYQNMALGTSAMLSATTAQQNVAVGYSALSSMTTGVGSVAIGASALLQAVNVDGCVAIGTTSMRNATYGYQSVGVGFGTLYRYAGAYAVAVGGAALSNSVAAFGQTAVGYESLASGNVGAYTTAVGYRAGRGAVGANSVFIGANAGDKETGSNRLMVDNASRASEAVARDLALIYGEFAATAEAQRLKLNSPVRLLTTTVAALPAASIGVGFRATVTDATAPMFGGVVAGGGATVIPVYSDGATWRVG